jgi:hypothetical protein
MVAVNNRAVMRGASSARGIAMMRLVLEGAGNERWVREWTSIGLVARDKGMDPLEVG